jgi:class 3 adenylate cyclase
MLTEAIGRLSEPPKSVVDYGFTCGALGRFSGFRAARHDCQIVARETLVTESQSGIVAFLFTDIEGSTRLWESAAEAMSAALRKHDALLHGLIAESGGYVFKTAGDAFCAVFPAPIGAIEAAVAAQRAIGEETWSLATPLRVRMAIHAGHAEMRAGDYFGPPLNRVARLLATSHGEQIVVSRAAAELARNRLPPSLALRDLGEFALKDLQLPERIFQVLAPGLRESFPPLQTPERLLRNLPQPATPLIGREAAVQTARATLGFPVNSHLGQASDAEHQRDVARLLTLTGPGGTG